MFAHINYPQTYLKPRNLKVQVVMFYGNHQRTIFGFLTPKKTEICNYWFLSRLNRIPHTRVAKRARKSTKFIEQG